MTAVLAAFFLPVLAVLSAPPAAAGGWVSWGETDSDDGDAGGSSVYTELRWNPSPPDSSAGYTAQFLAYNEILIVEDNRVDGDKVRAVLTVEGEGTAAFVGSEVHNLSYSEGKSYWLQVCIDGTSICSEVFRGRT